MNHDIVLHEVTVILSRLYIKPRVNTCFCDFYFQVSSIILNDNVFFRKRHSPFILIHIFNIIWAFHDQQLLLEMILHETKKERLHQTSRCKCSFFIFIRHRLTHGFYFTLTSILQLLLFYSYFYFTFTAIPIYKVPIIDFIEMELSVRTSFASKKSNFLNSSK